MGMGGSIAARMRWTWGRDPYAGTKQASNNLVNSTGAGNPYNCQGLGLQYTFLVETNDSAYDYQIRSGRNSSGPWSVLSSGSGTATGIVDTIQLPGPFTWVSPRVSSLASTANYVLIEMIAYE